MAREARPKYPWPSGKELARVLNDECIRQGANILGIFEAAGRIVAAYCIHFARRAIDQERLEPTNAAADKKANEILERFVERVQDYIRDAVERGEDPLDETKGEEV